MVVENGWTGVTFGLEVGLYAKQAIFKNTDKFSMDLLVSNENVVQTLIYDPQKCKSK